MTTINKKINIYYLLSILYVSAISIFNSITYSFLLRNKYSMSDIGIYLSFFWIACLISEIPTGILVDVLGVKKSIIISSIIRIFGLFILIFNFSNVLFLLFSALLTGLSEAIMSGNLSSWIVNELKKDNLDFSVNKIFGKNNILCNVTGLLFGFIGADILYKINIALPFYYSILFFGIIILITFITFSNKVITENETQKIKIRLKDRYIEIMNHIIKVIKNKKIWFIFTFFSIPMILDVGPANQWQKIYENNALFTIGTIWILIGIAGIVGDFIYSKIKINYKKIFFICYMLDLFCLIFMSKSQNYIFLFIIHVIIYSIISTTILTYVHENIVEDDDTRTSIISVYNTFEALIISFLVSLNGYLSDKFGILKAWKIQIRIAILVLLILLIIRFFKIREKR